MPDLELRGGVLRYAVDGPPGARVVLLANSLGTTVELWRPQLVTLTRYCRVVRYELRGHGGSTPSPAEYTIDDLGGDALALLDALGLERVSVAGLSLGGAVAIWLAVTVPERVDRVVLCCTAPTFPPSDMWRERAAFVREHGTRELVEKLVPRWFTPAYIERRGPAIDAVEQMLARCSPEGYAGCCAALATLDLRPSLARVQAPTLVLAGAEDPVCPPSTALALQAAIAGAGLVVVPGASHLANLEQPQVVADALVDHIVGAPLERGLRRRREVLGDEHVDRALARRTPVTEDFQDLITRYAWGEIWSRGGLDPATRSCVTLALLVALGRFDELEMHLRAARRIGLTPAQIEEVLLQTAIYCGVPNANQAFGVAQRVLGALDDDG